MHIRIYKNPKTLETLTTLFWFRYENRLASSKPKPQLLFFSNFKILSQSLTGMTSFTSPVLFTIWVFYFIYFSHINAQCRKVLNLDVNMTIFFTFYKRIFLTIYLSSEWVTHPLINILAVFSTFVKVPFKKERRRVFIVNLGKQNFPYACWERNKLCAV